MKKQIGFYFFIFNLLVAQNGYCAQLDMVKWWSFMRRFWMATVLGTGIFLISAIDVSYGQATSTKVPASPATNASTSTVTNVSAATITNEPAYTVAQLTNLINANVDTNLFVQQLNHWGVNWDVATILKLHSNGVSDADLQYIEQAFKLAHSNAPIGSTNPTTTPGAVQASGSPSNPPPATVNDAGASQVASVSSQTASLKLAGVTNLNLAAITNLSMAATNVPMARTNLPVVADYAQQMATNLSILQTNDIQAYSIVTNNLADIATGIRGYAAGLQLQTNFPSRPYQAFISVGAEFLNPFTISVPNPTSHGQGVLTNAGSSTVGFVEFDYINRHVLRNDGRESVTATNWYDFGGNWMIPSGSPPDVQFNMGFLFSNSTGITNRTYTAQALAGADFYSRLDLGFPLWRLDLPEQSHQVSLELSGGVGTEKNFELIHPNAFVGLGYETSFRPFLQSTFTNNCGFFEAKAGVGWVDLPSLVGTNNLVRLDGNGSPMFDFRPACELSSYLAYPLTDKIYLTVEAADYLGYRPPQSWNVKVGVSVPLASVTTVFSSLISSVGGSP